MSSTNYTSEDLAALDAALAKGVKIVKYTDKEITYRTLEEMFELRNFIKGCLESNNGRRGTRSYASTSKGLC